MMPDIKVAYSTQLSEIRVGYKVDDGYVETRGAYLEIARGSPLFLPSSILCE